MLKLTEHQNTKKRGDVGLGIAIAYFTKCGYTVCFPLTDSQDYDLVVDDGSLKKVQVKTTIQQKNGKYQVGLRTRSTIDGTNIYLEFNPGKVDYLFVLTSSNDMYLIPSQQIMVKKGISLCDKYSIYKIDA
jgi:hypothetical protein